MSHHTVDCSKAPYDLRPATEEITQQIFDLKNPKDGKNKPVIVIMGEVHTNPLHRLLQQGVLARCSEAGLSVAYHMEREHNLLGHIARTRRGIQASPQLDGTLAHHDKDGQILAKIALKYAPVRYATAAAENILGFCLGNGIATAFTDVAKRYSNERDQVFDWRDPETQLTTPHNGTINVESPHGMTLRNRFMAQKTADLVVQRQPDVVVHHCGREHVLGDSPSGFSFAESLFAKFLAQGFLTIAVFPSTKTDQEKIPPEGLEETTPIIVSGLADCRFGNNDPNELSCIQQCAQASGTLIDTYAGSAQIKIWMDSASRSLSPLITQARKGAKTTSLTLG